MKAKSAAIASTQRGPVTSIVMDMADTKDQWVYLTSDLHIDAACCAREALLEDFDEAVQRKAQIIVAGDIFDAMQGRFDPRRSMEGLRPEYRREDYYDFVVTDVARVLAPYAKNIVMLADGNHEMSVLKNANTNLTDRLVHELNAHYGGKVQHGGYGGWVRWMWEHGGTPGQSIKMKYFHGSGGEAPVTMGAIQSQRQAAVLGNADIVLNGHSHNSYWMARVKECLSNKGDVWFVNQHHIRTPGYHQGYGDGTKGWEVTSGKGPKPIGGVWLRMIVKSQRVSVEVTPNVRAPMAVEVPEDMYDGISYPDD